MTMQIESRKDVEKTKGGSARYWEIEFQAAEAEEKEYREKVSNLEKKYRAEDDNDFNVFFANVETLKPILFGRTPKPDVRPKLKSIKDHLSLQTSIMLETALDYSCGEYDFDEVMEAARDDRLIGGRGVARVLYDVTMVDREEIVAITDPVTGEVSYITQKSEEIGEQSLELVYVNREDYLQSPAKKWRDVRWVAFRHTPTREEAVKQFGEIAEDIPLNYQVLGDKEIRENAGNSEVFKRAEIWEIWDKQTLTRKWFVKGFPKLLAEDEDPYTLDNFFPLPKPLLGITTNGTMVPVPDYEEYRKQAIVVEETTSKIDSLTEQLQVKGLYSMVSEEIEKLINQTTDRFIPVLNIDPSVKLADQIVFWPIEKIAEVIVALYQAREQALQVIYQITGLSDIIRGASDPNETAKAQELKGNYANTRLSNLQKPMQVFVRGLLRLKAEIISEHFTPEKLAEITNMQLESEIDPASGQAVTIGVMDMVSLLRDEKLRKYRIDIETDSMVQADEDEDKKRRIEFMTAVTSMISQLAPLVQAGMMSIEVAKQMIGFGAKGFKVGRELEDALEQLGDPAEQQQQQPQPPSPEEMTMQLEAKKLELETQKNQKEIELKAAKVQNEAQLDEAKLRQQEAAEMAKLQMQERMEMAKMQTEVSLQELRINNEFELAKYKAELDAQVKYDVGMNRSMSNANA